MTTPPTTRLRAYRAALDPTTEQRRALARQAGAARWVYNWALARWREQYAEHKAGTRETAPSAYSLHKELTPLKQTPELAWLTEVSAYVVREAVLDVGVAYKHFWRRLKEGQRGRAAGEPQFRKRSDGQGFRVAQPQAVDARPDAVKVAGIGWIKLAEHGYLPVAANYRGLACREVGGRWYVAVQVEEDAAEQAAPRAADRIGVEVGVRVLAQTSDGDTFGAVRDLAGLARTERRRKLWERRMARRHQRGKKRREQSAGWREAVRHVAALHATCADIRRDKLHQTTTRIVRKARGATLVLRDMQVSKMLCRAGKSGQDARARNAIAPMVAKVGMYELRRQIAYKQSWRGGDVVIAPSSYPSTRTCSACGVVRETDPGYPSWMCGACGARHDRELNSARNLRDFAGGNPGGDGGQAGRRKTARKAAQRPEEPDQSTAEVNMTPTATPDGGGAASVALASLGTGNRAGRPQGSPEKRGRKPHATGGAVSARRQSISVSIERRGDADLADQKDRAVASPPDGPAGDRSQAGSYLDGSSG